MFRICFILLCYVTAILSIYAATTIDPVLSFDSTWSPAQQLAALLLVVGLSSKLLGHVLLMQVANQ